MCYLKRELTELITRNNFFTKWLLDYATDGIGLINLERNEIYLNKVFWQNFSKHISSHYDSDVMAVSSFRLMMEEASIVLFDTTINKALLSGANSFDCQLQFLSGDILLPFEVHGDIISNRNDGGRRGLLRFSRRSENVESRQFADLHKFKRAFEISNIGMALTNYDNELISYNRELCRIFGLNDADDTEVKDYLSYKTPIHVADRGMMEEKWKQLVNGELRSFAVEVRYYKKDKTVIWCCVHVSNDQDRFILFQIEDITATKGLEEKAEENYFMFKNAFELSPTGLALLDSNNIFLAVNASFLKVFRETDWNFIGQDLNFFRDKTGLDLKELVKNTESFPVENKEVSLSLGNRKLYLLVNISRFCTHKDGVCFIIQFHDITERVIMREELQTTVNKIRNFYKITTSVFIVETDQFGSIKLFNSGAEKILGYRLADAKVRENIISFFDPAMVDKQATELSTAYNRPIEGFDTLVYQARLLQHSSQEWVMVRKDKKKIYVQLAVTPIIGKENTITGYTLVGSDITYLRNIERKLRKEKEKAEVANKAKSEFLANMSHEIRTPLNGVIGFTDLLMQTELSENQSTYVQMLKSSAGSLLGIINDILDFSKIEAGKMDLYLEDRDITEVCESSLNVIKGRLSDKKINLLFDYDPKISYLFGVDAVRLQQVLVNLLGNAVKFTEKGEVELKVTLLTETDRVARITFAVSDTGIGIAKDKLEKIFRAFDQADSSTTKRYGGTGLGITITNRLLALMRSRLEVTSTEGKGSVFYFTLELEKKGKIAADGKLAFEHALIVDNNIKSRNILKNIFASNGIKSTVAPDGVMATELFEKQTFDLVIADYELPFMDGNTVINFLKEKFRSKPATYVLTVNFQNKKYLNDSSIAADHLLIKPLSLNMLHSVLNRKKNISKRDTDYFLTARDYSILVAEDNPVNQHLIKSILYKLIPNLKLEIAQDGEQAILYYGKKEYDLVLMDLQMPKVSGLEAVQAIRNMEEKENMKRTPIVALTAHVLEGEKDRCLAAGMDDYLTKPLSFENLLTMLDNFLNK